MRFTFVESMIDPAFYLPLARACEASGFHSFAIPDSIIYPETSDTLYPYTQNGDRHFLEDRPTIDPFVLMSAIAAVTRTLCFYPFVYKLPVRQPVLVAKQAASLAALSNNRLRLGVGLSPWPEDYAACGERWEKRGKRLDEMLTIIRGLTEGNYFSFSGDFYQLDSIKLCPAPTERIPILIGGHSDAALKRAAQHGDGWLHAGGEAEDLDPLLQQLMVYRKQFGHATEPFQIHVISADAYNRDGILRLQDKGVTDVIIGFHDTYSRHQDLESLDAKLAHIDRYANNIIAKL